MTRRSRYARKAMRLAFWVAGLCAACAQDPPARPKVAQAPSSITMRDDITPITRVEDALPSVFVPPYTHCTAPKEGDSPGSARDGGVCTQVAISGCTEPGKYFPDYGSCEVVRTQRPFWPSPPAGQTAPDDPRLKDAEFMSELAWMTEQVEASGCTCCHDANVGETGQWDIRRGPIWLDSLSDPGLALFIGLADSSVLGAYSAEDNFGFDRTQTGIPTDDTERMQAFLLRELERRGISREEAEAVPPFGGPIYETSVMPPTACGEGGHGITPDLRVQWSGGPARYVYVLEAGSKNPGVPPNLDQPEGTLWKLDVLASAQPIEPGLKYGTTPPGSFQALPATEPAPQLEPGRIYQLTVLRDVGLPLANCTFEFGDELVQPATAETNATAGASAPPPVSEAAACTLPGGDARGFGATCADSEAHSDCSCEADYCAKMPGQTQGICTITGCKEDPSICPQGYRCFDLSAFMPDLPSICTK